MIYPSICHYCGQVAALMVLNLFSFLLGFSALLSFAVNSVHAVALKTSHQVRNRAAVPPQSLKVLEEKMHDIAFPIDYLL